MKKVLMIILFSLLVFSTVFAEFIWDPLVFGYTNVNRTAQYLGLGIPLEEKQSANLFNVSTLLSGLGYMPADKGFYFMWENYSEIGSAKYKPDVIAEDGLVKPTTVAINYSSNFIFGYAFTPIENLHLSFGAGLALGATGIVSTYREALTRATVTVNFGLPIDVTARYFFAKRVGIMFGLQDTISKPIGATAISVGSESKAEETRFGVQNTFRIKLGLTTRW